MKRVSVVLLLMCGCFGPQDRTADNAFRRAITDQRLIAAQDQREELARLDEARKAGIKIIEEQRRKTGKSLEGLIGPDGRPLLTFETVEMLMAAFSDLSAKFQAACDGIDKRIAVRHAQKTMIAEIGERYIEYQAIRREAGQYAWQAFAADLSSGLELSEKEAGSIPGQLTSLGLPTSVDQLGPWLQKQLESTMGALVPKLGGSNGQLLNKLQGLLK